MKILWIGERRRTALGTEVRQREPINIVGQVMNGVPGDMPAQNSHYALVLTVAAAIRNDNQNAPGNLPSSHSASHLRSNER